MLSLLNLLGFLAVVVYGLHLFFQVVYSRYKFIQLGKASKDEPDLKERIGDFLVNVFGQRKLFKDKKSGLMHFILFYTFFIVQIGLLEIILKGFIRGYEFPLGAAHRYFSLIQEWATFLMLLAVLYGAYRRYGEKVTRLQWKRDLKAAVVYAALTVLTVTIFLSLGFERIMLERPPDWIYAPFSGAVTVLFAGVGAAGGEALFYASWWVHILTVFSFMVFVPQSKQAHELFAMFNVVFRKPGPAGRLRKIDFDDEEEEEFGVGRIENFTRRQLIDLYACVECGRCTNMCPASGTGKSLSPMHLITKMRDHLTVKGAAVTSRSPWMPSYLFANAAANRAARGDLEVTESLIGDVVTAEELWACTTCRNCEDQCPVSNEHVDKIIDMRRYLVMTRGDTPPELSRVYQNIERQGNPWGLHRSERVKWREGMEYIVPTVQETSDFEYLFFVGSMGSYDNRSIKIARAFAQLLHIAGVKFAILGNEEKNSGDTARRSGNEFLFQQLAAENIETFRKYNVSKIVTICPHTYNTFKNEYPEFGLQAEVWHHTELLAKLIREGRIVPGKSLERTVVYHDSCYLGRYNGVYDPPREILKSIPGITLLEMKRSRENSMCCGAGGGLMWMEDKQGKRINIERVEQALALSPSLIGSACPYCLTMLGDGTKGKGMEKEVGTLDIAEILLQSL